MHVAETGTLTIAGITLRGGDARFEFGGAILNDGGALHIHDSVITDNTADSGGAIRHDGGFLTIANSTLSNNRAGFNGGGIDIQAPATVEITNSTLFGNRAADNAGGGISNEDQLTITNSTIVGNRAKDEGGGISNCGEVRIVNSTIVDNEGGRGGGIENDGGRFELLNTIVTRNSDNDCEGQIESLGHNILGTRAGCAITLRPTDLTGNPGLDTFTNNGRPGRGYVPVQSGSPAIAAADAAACPPTDQLGQPRGDRCEIGAVEVFPTRDRFAAVAVCDFDGNRRLDLAVGDAQTAVAGLEGAGQVRVRYDIPSPSTEIGLEGQLWHQDSPNVRGSVETGDAFGYALAAGDFNQDSYCDLAIGVPGEDLGQIVDGGLVQVLYGSPTGLQASDPDNQLWHQNSASVGGHVEAGDRFGSGLGAGDFNGDGISDLAIGVPDEDVEETVDGGLVNVLYGTPSGLQAKAPNDQVWHQGQPGVRGSVEAGDQFGYGLGVGDFNGDRISDLAIGVPGEDVGDTVDAGLINVLYGTRLGLQSSAPDDQLWHQGFSALQDNAEMGDAFGRRLIGGDFNGDDFDDVAIQVPGDMLAPSGPPGAVHLLFGAKQGLQAVRPDDQLSTFAD